MPPPDSSLPLIILRCAVFAVACWNLRWSYRGVCELARGKVWPPSLYQSQIFWSALASASFGMTRFFHGGEMWRASSFTLTLLALTLAAIGHHQGSQLRARKFYSLYDHLEVALAIVALARVAPSAASEIADECRRRTAALMVARADG